jgi:hypothetical protein
VRGRRGRPSKLRRGPGRIPGLHLKGHEIGDGGLVRRHACQLGFEGSVSKTAAAPYTPGSRRLWREAKCINRQEFVVVGRADPEGSPPYLGALLLGYYTDEGKLIGICRDFAHLAMNTPARYCTGYLGDIGVPVDPNPMDFSASAEVFLDGRWYTIGARHNHPRIRRIVMGRGRDAAHVPISTAFGIAKLARFEVITQEQTQDG